MERLICDMEFGSNKADAASPAMMVWLAIEDQWRRVADLKRSTGQEEQRGRRSVPDR